MKGERPYDSNNKVKGRKRHIMVDVLELLSVVVLDKPTIQERAVATILFQQAVQKGFVRLEFGVDLGG